MYRFTLHYPRRLARWDAALNFLEAGDQLFLQPIKCISEDSGPAEKCSLQPLRESTTTRRIASMTCIQSRQVVLEMYPDTLTFRLFPRHWGLMVDGPVKDWDSPDGAGFPEHVLRFNGAKDIFIFNANWEDQDSAIKIATLRGCPPDDFLKIRHVGIAVDEIKSRHVPRQLGLPRYGTWQCRDRCATEECRDCCQKEPLPGFLSLFPLSRNSISQAFQAQALIG
ncbi:hypothetical protein BKA61DRAFT_247950 [Leptodontidium sp. MPI-SDFR-AT-0119]|nr:hypothetical protein BKA61DRAFT_247950 [Leptodontidium sp. MPI-SDFR-AT-0119]